MTGIRAMVKGHPGFPSLLSIAQSLELIGIKTKALKGTTSDLSENDYPSIAHLKSDRFIIVEKIDKNEVHYIDPGKGRISCKLKDFAEIWSGVVLRGVANKDAGEKNYLLQRKEEIFNTIRNLFVLPGLIILFTLIFAYGLTENANLNNLLFLWGVKLIGLTICLIMFIQSSVMQFFCNLSKRASCLKVLNSPAGKILGISVAELGVLYFSSSLITLLFLPYIGQMEFNIFILVIMNLSTLPYTIFSIYYQAFVLNAWCLLCLTVQALFWIEFFLFLDTISYCFSTFSWMLVLPLILGVAISILIWIGIRTLLIKAKRTNYLEQKLFWLKSNEQN
jgi:uncharacterized membrane protein